jgi:transposase InsO family protein
MSNRHEFVMLARAPGANIQALCRAFGVSRKTGYKWLQRYAEQGVDGLQDRSRRPQCSPNRTDPELEAQVVQLHDQYPCWGGRKLESLAPADSHWPHPNTVSAILKRHDRKLDPHVDALRPAVKRFEHEAPNLLWQMDFKGHFALTDKQASRCHPLNVLDDHSRFNICLTAFPGETGEYVKTALTEAFRQYGLPQRITCDNGAPWGTTGRGTLSRLEVWLIRAGIDVRHSRPYHPQTQGKAERFHRTLKRELLNRYGFNSIERCQNALDDWRNEYNLIRPHEALDQRPPISRFAPSGRSFPEVLPPIQYDDGEQVRKVQSTGRIRFKRHYLFVGEGLTGESVAVRPAETDGVFKVVFCTREVGRFDLRRLDE